MKVMMHIPWFLRQEPSGMTIAYYNYLKMLNMAGIKRAKSIFDDYDIFHEHAPDMQSLLYMNYSKMTNAKSVITTHASLQNLRGSMILGIKMNEFTISFAWPIIKRIYLSAQYRIAPSEEAKEEMEGEGIPVDEVISNGIDVGKFNRAKPDEFVNEFGINDFVLSVGYVFMRKGVDVFWKLAKQNPGKKFVWIGKYQGMTGNEAGKYFFNPLKNLRFIGHVEDVSSAYKSSRVFLFPSRQETQGLVVLEAAASGIPMVIRDLPVYDWLEHEKDCFKASSIREFDEYLNALWDDRKLRKKFSRRAFSKVFQLHSIERSAKKLKKFYLSIM